MDKKNMRVAVYFRTATAPIEQKVWLYASSKSIQSKTEWRDLSVEAMKHTARQNGLVVAGVSTDSSRQLAPHGAGPAFRKCWRLSVKDGWVR